MYIYYRYKYRYTYAYVCVYIYIYIFFLCSVQYFMYIFMGMYVFGIYLELGEIYFREEWPTNTIMPWLDFAYFTSAMWCSIADQGGFQLS